MRVIAPINRYSNIQVITSPFGMRKLRGSVKMHRGADLRSRRFNTGFGYVPQWGLQNVVACEDSIVLRMGTDKKGNDYIVFNPLYSDYDEIKYIHITIMSEFCVKGGFMGVGDFIGKTQIKGSSKAHHLHFEIWKDGNAVNPILYFQKYGIRYRYK